MKHTLFVSHETLNYKKVASSLRAVGKAIQDTIVKPYAVISWIASLRSQRRNF